ncbi:MAG: amidophosphoribosyltransferase [Bacteroidetes bacterium]|nr:MAG: amidophosphoribosyltransferase [Bacteroidota bacterium]
MSDQIKHECGIALIRLLKPLDFYRDKYGSALYGLHKMQLLLQKQRNRGQDGAGIATIKLDPPPGSRYISRKRTNDPQYLRDLFQKVFKHFDDVTPDQMKDAAWLKENKPFTGELLMGHLRYGTHGVNTIEACHPFLRLNNWITRNLVLAGNFNLTNVDELFDELIALGQFPKEKSDTVTVLEKLGHFLDDEVQRLYNWFKADGYDNEEINEHIIEHLDIQRFLRRACKKFDGGYVMAGMIGHGDAFVIRDPHGIRPAYYYQDDEIVVVASERPPIQTALGVRWNTIQEIKPGHALIIKKDGEISELPYTEPLERKSCSFERIYFSRGTDRDIYLERKRLGELLAPRVLEAVDYDIKNTVFSFVPNTAEVAFQGLIDGMHDVMGKRLSDEILKNKDDLTKEKLDELLANRLRIEKLAVKDAKLRTFIADSVVRGEMVSHVYDVTYGIVKNEIDTIVLLDDSIVRGTTLKDSIIQIVSKLYPKRIIIVSSAPQIRYPDCYGIDMSKMKDFVAFRALVELLKERGMEDELTRVFDKCKLQEGLPREEMQNYVPELYGLFTDEEISAKIAQIVTPEGIEPKVEVIYQTLDALHEAIPNHTGDWYFSGDFPTSGGVRVINRAFINYMEGKDVRAYA